MLTGSPQLNVDRLGTISILHVIGDIDEASSSHLDAALRDAATDCEGPLIVAFVECPYAAVTCLDVLMRQFKVLPTRLSVVAPPKSHVRSHFDRMPLGSVPPVHDGFREAILAICEANRIDRTTDRVDATAAACESASSR